MYAVIYNHREFRGDDFMSLIRENIKKVLSNKDEISKKIITVSLDEELITSVDKISKVFSELNKSKSFSRNSIIEMAVKAFVDETTNILSEEYEIDIENELPSSDDNLDNYDLAIFPAHNEGFEQVFLEENCWYAVRIKNDRIPKIKYVAIYRSAPVSAITHYAKVKEIAQYEDTNKKIIYFEGKAIKLENKVVLGDTDANSMRSPRYTTREKLIKAKDIKQLFI